MDLGGLSGSRSADTGSKDEVELGRSDSDIHLDFKHDERPNSGTRKWNAAAFSTDADEMSFFNPGAGTPLAQALAANAAIKVGKVQKTFQRKWRGIKGPKMKNFNVVRQIRKHKKKNKKLFSKNFKGKVIDGVHELYTLTVGMMLGLRCTVGRSGIERGRELLLEDFSYVEKRTFPPGGSNNKLYQTPAHVLGHTFKFKSYAPEVFQRIRQFSGIDIGNYMMSVCGDCNFLEFMSNSKSGQFFFYSHDGKFMIKTQSKEENRFMKRILPFYYQFMMENPNSMLVRFLGMHRVKMYHLRRKHHFVIMTSVFDTPEQIHTIYDLKGSRVGRGATEKEKASGGVLKDNDLVDAQRKFHFGSKKEKIIEQLEKDSKFLASLNIMDYSLLIGIHDRKKALQQRDSQSRSNTPFRDISASRGADVSLVARDDHEDLDVDGTPGRRKHRRPVFSTDAMEDGLSPAARALSSEEEEEDDLYDQGDEDEDEDEEDDDLDDESCATDSVFGESEIPSFDKVNESEIKKLAGMLGKGAGGKEGARVASVFQSPSAFAQLAATNEEDLSHLYAMSSRADLVVQRPWTSRTDGGINSRTSQGRGDEIYFAGVIDILQKYNIRKHSETFFKSFTQDVSLISSVDPHTYAKRFVQFIRDNSD